MSFDESKQLDAVQLMSQLVAKLAEANAAAKDSIQYPDRESFEKSFYSDDFTIEL